ncbi:MAG: helix-hairpin-helix domain-containing protein, partial [Acidobacteriota bacterium]
EGLDFAAPAPELSLPGIHDEVVLALKQAGYDTAEKILNTPVEQLAGLEGFDTETAEAVIAAARESQGNTETSAEQSPAEGTGEAPAGEESATEQHEEVK